MPAGATAQVDGKRWLFLGLHNTKIWILKACHTGHWRAAKPSTLSQTRVKEEIFKRCIFSFSRFCRWSCTTPEQQQRALVGCIRAHKGVCGGDFYTWVTLLRVDGCSGGGHTGLCTGTFLYREQVADRSDQVLSSGEDTTRVLPLLSKF